MEEVVYHDTSFIWGVISFLLLSLSILFWFVASRTKRVKQTRELRGSSPTVREGSPFAALPPDVR